VGLALPWLYFVVSNTLTLLALRDERQPSQFYPYLAFFLAAPIAGLAGTCAAAVGVCIWRRRLHFPLALAGGWGGMIAVWMGAFWFVGPVSAALIGLVAGALVILTTYVFDQLNMVDPAGAVAVHGVCGAWGILAVGLFPDPFAGTPMSTAYADQVRLSVQLLGFGACAAPTLVIAAALFWLVRRKLMIKPRHDQSTDTAQRRDQSSVSRGDA